MRHVIIRNYAKYHDISTGTQFEPVLDPSSGTFVGVAQVDDEKAAAFESRPAFDVLSPEEYHAAMSAPDGEPDDAAAVSQTGDPLADAAGGLKAPAPPAPKR